MRAVAGLVDTFRAVLAAIGLLTAFRLAAGFLGAGFGLTALAILAPVRAEAWAAFDTDVAADAGRRALRRGLGGENALIKPARADFLRATRVAPLGEQAAG